MRYPMRNAYLSDIGSVESLGGYGQLDAGQLPSQLKVVLIVTTHGWMTRLN